ncbi:hypothetical protein ACWENQ_44920 [Nonomuraea sp. NPDC004354]
MSEDVSDIRWDRVVAQLLRKVPAEVAEEFLAGPDWRDLPALDRQAIEVADAELEELDRLKRQQARQQAAEEAARRH